MGDDAAFVFHLAPGLLDKEKRRLRIGRKAAVVIVFRHIENRFLDDEPRRVDADIDPPEMRLRGVEEFLRVIDGGQIALIREHIGAAFFQLGGGALVASREASLL